MAEELARRLDAYLDGELETSEARRLERELNANARVRVDVELVERRLIGFELPNLVYADRLVVDHPGIPDFEPQSIV